MEKENMPKKWKDKTTFMKVITVINFILAIGILASAILDIANVVQGDKIYMPLLALMMYTQVVEYWKDNRKVAYLSLFAGILVTISVILDIFMH